MADQASLGVIVECAFCERRAKDVLALRREGGRGKQLGAWEREILRRSGPCDARVVSRVRPAGLPLLREAFPERDLNEAWDDGSSPSQSVLRAAGARLEGAGLVSLLAPNAAEAEVWIYGALGRDWPEEGTIRRRLLLGSFSWRTLLGDEIARTYAKVFGRAGSTLRMRWDDRLDRAHAVADQRCAEGDGHREGTMRMWSEALRNDKREHALPRR